MLALEKKPIRDRIHAVTVQEYRRMSELNLISEKTELIEGFIIEKMSKSPLHRFVVERFYRFFAQRLPAGLHVSQEQPLTFAASEPEPDIAVVREELADRSDAHPHSAEFIIEVAIASLEYDREKASIYARAGVPEYWIVMPESQTVERRAALRDGAYHSVETYSFKDEIFLSVLQDVVVPADVLKK